MKNQWMWIIVVVCAILMSLYLLYPTYQDYHYRTTLAGLRGADSLKYADEHQEAMLLAKLKRLKLGLDLQGGMRVVLEVDVLTLLDELAKNKDDVFRQVMAESRTEAAASDVDVLPLFIKKIKDRGIRLSLYYGSMKDDDAKVEASLKDANDKAIERAIEIVRNRVDQYRVSEPNIQKQGARRIIVELPGVKDQKEVETLLKGTAKLEFRLVKDPNVSYKLMETINNFLAGKVAPDSAAGTAEAAAQKKEENKDALQTLTRGAEQAAAADTDKAAVFRRENPFFAYVIPDQRGGGDGYVESKSRDRVIALLARPEIQRLIPKDVTFMWSAKSFKAQDGRELYTLYTVKSTPDLTGNVITDARSSVDPEDNRPVVNMEMSKDGAKTWAEVTGMNVGKRIAIALDGGVFSAPVVQQKIIGGRSRITGLDTPNEARLLEIVLRAGALPAPLSIIEQRAVGASLGEDSINAGVKSLLYSFIITVLFMVFYYHTAGAVADFALIFNLLFILGVMAGFQATFTLPGIAGMVLTIGMAVDANVLINERVREELAGGKTLLAAIDAGYDHSFSAIIDSNVTTFLTGAVLYQFGSGPVQGFALTLMIGIGATLFSAIIITRLMMKFMTSRGYMPNFG